MGLDIMVAKLGERLPDDGEDGLYISNEPEFQSRNTVHPEGFYRSERLFSFRAGSYSSYSSWRGMVLLALYGDPNGTLDASAKFSRYVTMVDEFQNGEPTGPLGKLLYFSDCNGVIDHITSKVLAEEMKAHREKVMAFLNIHAGVGKPFPDWFKDVYDEFTKAFELAVAHEGVVVFH